jgi:glycosyltransferase involved in cell wall biosynthesis
MGLNINPEFRVKWEIPTYEINLWNDKKNPYCVIIPVINEGERIKILIQSMSALKIHLEADIIIIDGGSNDGSLDLALLNEFNVSGLLTKTGLGKLGGQLRCAYSFALDKGYDGIITIDGNNKDKPEPIKEFISALKNGYDFVQASRFVKGGIGINTPISRWLAIKLIHAPILSFFSGFTWTDTTQGFRGYSRRLLLDEKISLFRDVFQEYELLAYLNYRAPILNYKCIELPTIRIYPIGFIPTKINGIKGQIKLLKTLFQTCLKKYNP